MRRRSRREKRDLQGKNFILKYIINICRSSNARKKKKDKYSSFSSLGISIQRGPKKGVRRKRMSGIKEAPGDQTAGKREEQREEKKCNILASIFLGVLRPGKERKIIAPV